LLEYNGFNVFSYILMGSVFCACALVVSAILSSVHWANWL